VKGATRNFLFIFFLVSGIIIGSLLAVVAEDVSWLSWLSYGTTVGFGANSPAVLDLAVLQVAFGFSLTITIAHIICIGIALSIYYTRKWR